MIMFIGEIGIPVLIIYQKVSNHTYTKKSRKLGKNWLKKELLLLNQHTMVYKYP